jgi:N,N'-diacetyllegionaminate synthase
MNERVLIIAEVGVNHNGDLDLARRIVDSIAETDVDIIKFQSGDPELVMVDSTPKAAYQARTTGTTESAIDMLRPLLLGSDQLRELKAHVESRGKEFLSTAFDLGNLAFLGELGLTTFKSPSGELTNLPYLRAMAGLADRMIISTGMADLDDVRAAIDAVTATGFPRAGITVLQCNTAYPTSVSDANLRAMVTMGSDLDVAVGYSDHTEGASAALAAVALGARVIEKHVTLDRTLPGPDQHASMEPDEFAAMVAGIREVTAALGSPVKAPNASELENRPIARRGVYAARPLAAGDRIAASDLVMLRPETDVSPMQVDSIVGRVLAVPLARHEPFSWEALRIDSPDSTLDED